MEETINFEFKVKEFKTKSGETFKPDVDNLIAIFKGFIQDEETRLENLVKHKDEEDELGETHELTYEEAKDPNFIYQENVSYNTSDEKTSSWMHYRTLEKIVPEVIQTLYADTSPDNCITYDVWIDETIKFTMEINECERSYCIDTEEYFKEEVQTSQLYSMVVELMKFEYRETSHVVYYTIYDEDYED
tara:strand:- start:63 stop:629 length:567 start_codon:yes stop_codon:yes gene_type:complete